MAEPAGRAVSIEELADDTGLPFATVMSFVVDALAAGLLVGDGSRLRYRDEEAAAQLAEALAGTRRRLEPPRPVEWLRWTAGRVGTNAPDTAVELLQAALPLADAAQRRVLVAELAVALYTACRYEEMEALCRQALEDPPPGMELRLRRMLVDSLFDRGLVRQASDEAEVAAGRAAPDRQAWWLAVRAMTPLFSLELDRAEQLGLEAERAAVAEGDDEALAMALRARLLAALQRCRLAEAGGLADRLVQAAARLPATEAAAQAHLAAALTFSDVDRHHDALHHAEEGTRLASSLGQAVSRHAALAFSGAVHVWVGDWDGAMARLTAATQVDSPFGWTVDVRCLIAFVTATRRDLAAAEAAAAEAEAAYSGGVPVSSAGRLGWMRAELALAAGDEAGALRHLVDAWLRTVSSGMVREQRRIGPPLVRLLVAAGGSTEVPGGRLDVAEVVLGLEQHSRRNPTVPGLAGVARWAAGLAKADGMAVVEALGLLRQSGRVHEEARCALDAAVLVADDRRLALSLANEALDGLDRLRATSEWARAMAVLRGAGLAPSGRRRVEAGVGWASLSDSERRVALLVADGLSNPQVAARLFVAPRTVSTHVSHILRKLGLRSRTELAVFVAREGPDGTGTAV